MKTLALLIVLPFFFLIVLTVFFQFARIILSEFKAAVAEAWHSPEAH
ncbi:MAG: hypothetical protein ACXWAT_17515 [Methylobacter sp.]